MDDEYQFDSFESMLEKFESEGFRVERISDSGAVVFNEGQEPTYSIFDNFVATVAVDNGFGFRTPVNMKELHDKTSHEKDSSQFEIYMGVFEDDPQSVTESDYEFRNDD